MNPSLRGEEKRGGVLGGSKGLFRLVGRRVGDFRHPFRDASRLASPRKADHRSLCRFPIVTPFPPTPSCQRHPNAFAFA